MNNLKPYIGITGITNLAETEYLIEQACKLGWPYERNLMLGYLASYKGMVFGELANPQQYLKVTQIEAAMSSCEHVMSIVHYNSRASGLYLQLSDLLQPIHLADGVQLNISWPHTRQLARFRRWNYCRVILQIGRSVLRQIGDNYDVLIDRLRAYTKSIDYVLIDMSDGTGTDFDLPRAATILAALVSSGLDMKWGIAGGLCAANIDRLEPLLEIYPLLSWDAQGKLRDKADYLDLGACREYLEASLGMARRSQTTSSAKASSSNA